MFQKYTDFIKSDLLNNYAHFRVTQTNNFPKHLTKTLRVTNKTKKLKQKFKHNS